MEETNVIDEMGFDMKGDSSSSNENKETAKPVEEKPDDNSAEETLKTIATITLVVGIIASLILFFTVCWVENPMSYSHKMMFNPIGFGTMVMVLVSSVISWATLKVFANISMTLKDIKNKMPK